MPRAAKPDEEVYEYDAATAALLCVRATPSGARPVGVLDSGEPGPLIDPDGIWGGISREAWRLQLWLAANVPGWTPFRLSQSRYQSRYLSNTGRLFFNARAPLVPADVNGTNGTCIEYEPEGIGSCTSSTSSGSDVFKPAPRSVEVEGRKLEEGPGCVGLISSGESGDASAFLDASATGGRTWRRRRRRRRRLLPDHVEARPAGRR